MSTLIEQVQLLLAPLVGGHLNANGVMDDARCYYQVNTVQPPVYPYITWFRVVSDPNVSLTGPSDLQNTRIQLDIFSRSVSELVALESAVEAAFVAWSVPNVPLSSQDLYEDTVNAFRTSKDYSIWSKD